MTRAGLPATTAPGGLLRCGTSPQESQGCVRLPRRCTCSLFTLAWTSRFATRNDLGAMPIREVALDRDVRSRRLLPPAARPVSAHTVRRAASVGTLVVIDCGSFLLAVVLVPLASNMSALALWHDLSSVSYT